MILMSVERGLYFLQSQINDDTRKCLCNVETMTRIWQKFLDICNKLLVSSESPILLFLACFGPLIFYKGKAVEGNKTNIKTYNVKGCERWRNDERVREEGEAALKYKALCWEGWKRLGVDSYLRKMISECFPTAPNASFFISLSPSLDSL